MNQFRIRYGPNEHTIGVDRNGVLTVFITSARRNGDGQPRGECSLELAGLDSESGSHLKWAQYSLEPGDRIEVDVLGDGEADPPEIVRKVDPEEEELRKKNYVRKMAAEYGWKLAEG